MLSALMGGRRRVVSYLPRLPPASSAPRPPPHLSALGRAKFCTLNGSWPAHRPLTCNTCQVFNQIRILCNLSEFLCSGSPRPEKLRNLTLSFVVLFHFISVRFASLMATFCHYTLRKKRCAAYYFYSFINSILDSRDCAVFKRVLLNAQ